MKLEHLKIVRIVVSLLFFLLTGILFLDIGRWIPPDTMSMLVAFQFVPAVTKTVVGIGLWTVGAACILVLTLVFGRVYCSSICPLGTLQDFIIRFRRIRDRRVRRRRKWFEYRRPHYRLHYTLLAVTVLLALLGSMTLLNLTEPFSNFGRIVQALARPILLAVNNVVAYSLSALGSYSVVHIPLKGFGVAMVAAPLLFVLLLFYLSYTHGRLFCNTLCPAGAVLGLVSRFALFKIVIDKNTCEDCGLCEKVCKAYCVDAEKKTVDFAACVSCFNCIESCPTVGVTYSGWNWPWEKRSASPPDSSRRAVLKTLVGPGVLLAGLPKDSATVKSDEPRQLHPVTPPGSRGIEHFSGLCTACHLCISTCPTQVLVPSLFEYGMGGLFQPKLDYWVSYCNYDCTICGEICPSGAILPLPLPEKKLVQLGKAVFVKEDCIVITKKTECGACSEHCPTKAVKMVPYEGKLTLPELKNEICVGCGACEHSCPTKPKKAIYVEAHIAHQQAKPPELKKPDTIEQGEIQEFPF